MWVPFPSGGVHYAALNKSRVLKWLVPLVRDAIFARVYIWGVELIIIGSDGVLSVHWRHERSDAKFMKRTLFLSPR